MAKQKVDLETSVISNLTARPSTDVGTGHCFHKYTTDEMMAISDMISRAEAIVE